MKRAVPYAVTRFTSKLAAGWLSDKDTAAMIYDNDDRTPYANLINAMVMWSQRPLLQVKPYEGQCNNNARYQRATSQTHNTVDDVIMALACFYVDHPQSIDYSKLYYADDSSYIWIFDYSNRAQLRSLIHSALQN